MLIKPHDFIPCFYAKYVFDIIEKYEVVAIFKRLHIKGMELVLAVLVRSVNCLCSSIINKIQ